MLRVLRTDPDPVEPSAPDAAPATPVAAAGLEGFDSETRTAVANASASRSKRSSWLIVALSALVLAEAIPTALWARQYFSSSATTAAAVVPPAAAAPAPVSTLGATPPCEPSANANTVASAPAVDAAAASDAGIAEAPKAIAAGVFSVVAPLPLQVYARGRLVGTSEAETMMLPLGSYELELVNESTGYRTKRTITVRAGQRTTLQIEPPNGTLHVNAVPWAEVWVDNRRLGETPIGNVPVPIGPHELVFRHPELGERRTRVLVTLSEPARVSVDLRKP